MTSSKTIHAVIFGHNELSRAFLETVKSIVGEVEGITILSNQGISRTEMEQRLKTVIDATEGETVIFADLFGGSCPMVCKTLVRERKNIAVICGVNLPMLLEFAFARDKMKFPELVEHLTRVGKDGIRTL
jgi:mannose/fructose-specific phosphotransferase system component IIA